MRKMIINRALTVVIFTNQFWFYFKPKVNRRARTFLSPLVDPRTRHESTCKLFRLLSRLFPSSMNFSSVEKLILMMDYKRS